MESRTFGTTGRTVTRLGLGLAALGRPGYINIGHSSDLAGGYDIPAMEARAGVVLDAAWAAGVRYFDAARSYGRGEEFLARWLVARDIAPNTVTVGSKWGYTYTAGWRVEAEAHEVKDHSLATLSRQWVESRERLGPYLNLYQIHSATRDSGVLEDDEVLRALSRLKADGLVIGLSLSGPEQPETLRRALEIVVDGERLFGCVQATWNVLEPSIGPTLALAHSAGMGVIIKEALANGRLTSRHDSPDFAPSRAVLDRLASRFDASIDAVALAAALAQPWADVVLSGATTVDQFRSNLQALAVAWDDQATEAVAALQEAPEVYWSTRARLPWN